MSEVATAPTIRIEGTRAILDFDRFDLSTYDLFLRAKQIPESETRYDWQADRYTVVTPARLAARLGLVGAVPEAPDLPLAAHLFDYQRWIVGLALESRKFAAWCDTGLGKTAIFIEFARQVLHRTGGRVLIFSPLAVIAQTIREAARWYGDDLPITRLATREALAAWCTGEGPALGICNYDKLIDGVLPELRYCAGLICDESSIVKTGGGVIKWNLIKSARGIEYKLSCTATPAPNEAMEYASQASFLEKLRTEGEIIWTYFNKQPDSSWAVKPHARQAFYEFMASWSVYLRDPAHFGFADILSSLPPPVYHEYRLDLTADQQRRMYDVIATKGGGLFSDDRMGVVERTKLAQLARGFLYGKDPAGRRTVERVDAAKPAFVADLVAGEVAAGRPTIVWTVFDEEGAIIADLLTARGVAAAVLDGGMSEDVRVATVEAFRGGAVPVLISKAQLVGYGLNLQNCRAMVFSGVSDSWEQTYQSVRRAYRFGQTETVHVHIPYVPELEGMMLSNIKRKEQRFNADVAIQEAHYRKALGMVEVVA